MCRHIVMRTSVLITLLAAQYALAQSTTTAPTDQPGKEARTAAAFKKRMGAKIEFDEKDRLVIKVDFSGKPVRPIDVAFLGNFSKLRTLSLARTQLKDDDLTPLLSLTTL